MCKFVGKTSKIYAALKISWHISKSTNILAPNRHQPVERICPIPCNRGVLNSENRAFGLAHNLHYMTRLNNSK